MRSDDCACNLHEYCNPCDCECHAKDQLTNDEIKTLYDLLKHQYIPYDNVEGITLVRKVARIANGRSSSQS